MALLMRVVKFFVMFAKPFWDSRAPGASYRSSTLSSTGVEVRLRMVRGTDAIVTFARDFENMKRRS